LSCEFFLCLLLLLGTIVIFLALVIVIFAVVLFVISMTPDFGFDELLKLFVDFVRARIHHIIHFTLKLWIDLVSLFCLCRWLGFKSKFNFGFQSFFNLFGPFLLLALEPFFLLFELCLVTVLGQSTYSLCFLTLLCFELCEKTRKLSNNLRVV
jgi:hypothetical protein